jgi:hypothetical protein
MSFVVSWLVGGSLFFIVRRTAFKISPRIRLLICSFILAIAFTPTLLPSMHDIALVPIPLMLFFAAWTDWGWYLLTLVPLFVGWAVTLGLLVAFRQGSQGPDHSPNGASHGEQRNDA